MQALTKQELQTAVTQLRASILGQTATKQDLSRAVTAISQQSATQLDVQQVLTQCTNRIVERTDTAFKQQNAFMQQMMTRLDVNAKQQAQTEDKLFRLEASIKDLLAEYETRDVAARQERVKQQDREKWVERQEAKFAQKAAFSGLF